MKNSPKTGRSARRGNAKSPYAKYGKRPYRYGRQQEKQHERKRPHR